MKNLISFIALFFIGLQVSFSQTDKDSTTNNADNFNLEGALAMFKQANSLEEFEKLINLESNSVHNLDLNNDEKADYISVNSIQDSDSHVIILQVWLNATEKQDIATIGIEKTGNEKADLQIIGDESIFGEEAIVEPFELTESIEKGKGPAYAEININTTTVNVWFWPCVRWVYAPNYRLYTSPFRWNAYPIWWKPWRPINVALFSSRGLAYKSNFHRTYTVRVVKARKIYVPRRSQTTLIVKNKRGTTVIRKGKRGKTTVIKRNRRR